jgi:hypothetical protein
MTQGVFMTGAHGAARLVGVTLPAETAFLNVTCERSQTPVNAL